MGEWRVGVSRGLTRKYLVIMGTDRSVHGGSVSGTLHTPVQCKEALQYKEMYLSFTNG